MGLFFYLSNPKKSFSYEIDLNNVQMIQVSIRVSVKRMLDYVLYCELKKNSFILAILLSLNKCTKLKKKKRRD